MINPVALSGEGNRKIECWYHMKGCLENKAYVAVFGMGVSGATFEQCPPMEVGF